MPQARDLISSRVVVVDPEQRLAEVAGAIASAQAEYCVVRDEAASDRVRGIVRLAAIAVRNHSNARIFADLINGHPRAVRPDADTDEVSNELTRTPSLELLVTEDDGAFLGLITASSMAAWWAEEQQEQRRVLEAALAEQKRLAQFLEGKVGERTASWQRSVEDFHRAALTLSHDLRRPLRSIMTLAEELASGQHGALNATGTSHAGQIARSAGRLEALAEEILGKAREAYAQGPAPEIAIDLDEVFRDAVAFLHQLITERHATVVIRSPMHRVVGRYVPMLQIAANLLTNALKHGPDDLPPRVDIWSEEISGRVRLSLKDNRGGLHPHAHAMLFEPFTSFAQQRTVESGLGLAITRGAIAQLGGGISVTTEQGVGSLFTVTLRPALPGSGSPFNGRQGN